jgi:hypothetical protein
MLLFNIQMRYHFIENGVAHPAISFFANKQYTDYRFDFKRLARSIAGARGMGGGNLALRMCTGMQGGRQGVANRKTLIDEFLNRDSCFGLKSARGIFMLKMTKKNPPPGGGGGKNAHTRNAKLPPLVPLERVYFFITKAKPLLYSCLS